MKDAEDVWQQGAIGGDSETKFHMKEVARFRAMR
jgi:hypothetical protein